VSEAVRIVIHSLVSVNGSGNRVKSKSDSRTENTLIQLQERLEELSGELKWLTKAVGQLHNANSRAEVPEPSTTTPNDVQDCGLVQLTDAIGHAPGHRDPSILAVSAAAGQPKENETAWFAPLPSRPKKQKINRSTGKPMS